MTVAHPLREASSAESSEGEADGLSGGDHEQYRIQPRRNTHSGGLYQGHYFEIDYIRFFKNKFLIEPNSTNTTHRTGATFDPSPLRHVGATPEYLLPSSTGTKSSEERSSSVSELLIEASSGDDPGWREEFDSPSSSCGVDGRPSARNWEYEIGIPRPGNWEAQDYTDQTRNAVCTPNGTLLLRAFCEEGTSLECATLNCNNQLFPLRCNTRNLERPSPWISSASLQMAREAVESGTLIARIRGNDTAKGAWSALWMMGEEWRKQMQGRVLDYEAAGRTWPACGEIDVRELNSKYGIIDEFAFFNETAWSPEYSKVGGVNLMVNDMPKDSDGWTLFVVEYRNKRPVALELPDAAAAAGNKEQAVEEVVDVLLAEEKAGGRRLMSAGEVPTADQEARSLSRKKLVTEVDHKNGSVRTSTSDETATEQVTSLFTDVWESAEKEFFNTVGHEDPASPHFVPPRNDALTGLRTWWLAEEKDLQDLTAENAVFQMPTNGKLNNRLITKFWETYEGNKLFVKLNLAIGGISEGPYFEAFPRGVSSDGGGSVVDGLPGPGEVGQHARTSRAGRSASKDRGGLSKEDEKLVAKLVNRIAESRLGDASSTATSDGGKDFASSATRGSKNKVVDALRSIAASGAARKGDDDHGTSTTTSPGAGVVDDLKTLTGPNAALLDPVVERTQEEARERSSYDPDVIGFSFFLVAMFLFSFFFKQRGWIGGGRRANAGGAGVEGQMNLGEQLL
eukprot:g14706.t1